MFEPSSAPTSNASVAEFTVAPARPGQFPLELETEFAELQAASPAGGIVPALLAAGGLFHVLLIAERNALSLPPLIFAERGGPATVVLACLLLMPPAFRQKDTGRTCLVLFMMILIMALLAGVPFAGAQQLLPMQTGVAVLLLLFGWLAALPRSWVSLLAAGALLADSASLLLSPALQSFGAAVTLESFWAPGFAVALLLLLAGVRQSEARRDFLLLRRAAFAGVPGTAGTAEDTRHLDPETGVANRLAFDMRFRAAWEQAAGRRHSVALLFFSVDSFAEQKRDLGYKFSELLQSTVAGLLKDGLRRSDDMVARFDNHHFVVMLPGVGTDGATQIAERLRGCVEDAAVFLNGKRRQATVTVGVASLRAKRGVAREKLIDCAVQALDQGRATGTNLVCVEGRGCIPSMS